MADPEHVVIDQGGAREVAEPSSITRVVSGRRLDDDGGGTEDVEVLVARCQAGDKEAFRQLFRSRRTEVARLVHRMLGRSSDFDDVIQEVFLQVHRSIREFRGQSRFTTWLYRVTVNVVLMHRRSAKSRPVFVDSPQTYATDERSPPDELVARQARLEAFARILDQLSEKKRDVFILHELEGLAPAEISTIVGAPVLTVRTRLFYARRELMRAMRDEPTLAALADELSDVVADGKDGIP